ncbi:response regulator, partial [Thermodesulfobacteriota bacterium]
VSQKKSIVIVDDHPLFREGLKAIIAREAGYQVIGEAGTVRAALRMVRELKPDLVLMDIALPDGSGIDATSEIRELAPHTHVMVVSMHSKIDYIVRAFQGGATGYVVKESASDRLLQGISTVLKGEYFMDSSVSHRVVQKLVQFPEKEARITDAAYETLTPREQEVMGQLAEGMSAKQISKKLFISPKTVENHRANIMAKLGLRSRMEIVRYAARLGLIDVDLWKE